MSGLSPDSLANTEGGRGKTRQSAPLPSHLLEALLTQDPGSFYLYIAFFLLLLPSLYVPSTECLSALGWGGIQFFKKSPIGTSLAVQWLRLRASNAGGEDSIPCWGTKIPHAMRHAPSTPAKIKSPIFRELFIEAWLCQVLQGPCP